MSIGGDVGSCSVAEVMGTEMFTVTPETAVSSAQRLVQENDVNHMLVLDNGTLAGIVCRDDLRFADRDARIGDCMTSPVLCITPDTTLQEAVDIMGANDIDCLPVVTGVFLVGIVTLEALSTANLSPTRDDDRGGDLDDQHDGDQDGYDLFSDSEQGQDEQSDDELETTDGAAGICGACASDRDVAIMSKHSDLSLCGRCRRVMFSNQRC
ncbi:MAG: CBS domain-containing protein [Myxococcales bacterium]